MCFETKDEGMGADQHDSELIRLAKIFSVCSWQQDDRCSGGIKAHRNSDTFEFKNPALHSKKSGVKKSFNSVRAGLATHSGHVPTVTYSAI